METTNQINEIKQTGIAVFNDGNLFSVSIINILLLVIILLLDSESNPNNKERNHSNEKKETVCNSNYPAISDNVDDWLLK